MMQPKVSVITCSHNRPEMLRAAIESLRRQTDPDWEHLIYDDCSTDPRVWEVLTWAKQDPRVRVWYGTTNIDRPSVLWNFMLDRARGRYFTNLDDDNEKLPQFVERMSGELDADPTLGLVTCGWVVIRPDGQKETDYHLNLSTCASELSRISTCDGGAMLYRRELFEQAGYFSEALRTNEDWDWMRRAILAGKVKNLHECLATYRSHTTNRMIRCEALGNSTDVVKVRERGWSPTFGLRITRPHPNRLTRSQEDVTAAVCRAVETIPWLSQGFDRTDLALVISPFQLTDDDIKHGIGDCRKILSYHMEDPYALAANLERVKCMVATGREVWVSTNDAAAVQFYRGLVGDRVIVCPSLGPDSTFQIIDLDGRDIDILICGYAYPSRKRFMDKFLPLVSDKKVVLIGDGWEDRPVEVYSTLDLASTYGFHARARAVVCLQRIHGDCSDGPVEPKSVCRGFMEGFCGPRVFLDRTRPDHQFDDEDVVWFDGPEDLAAKLREFLSDEPPISTLQYAQRCARDFTYRARLIRLINCVRAPRVLPVIP